MALVFALVIGWILSTYLLVRALSEKDRHHALQLSSLLNRIQAPEHTVAQELVKDDDYDPIVLPHNEKTYWEDIQHIKVGD